MGKYPVEQELEIEGLANLEGEVSRVGSKHRREDEDSGAGQHLQKQAKITVATDPIERPSKRAWKKHHQKANKKAKKVVKDLNIPPDVVEVSFNHNYA
ncbi:hypothetical protein PM082_017724 [Marasmius tenuissimus]|nr:hypothetical protein PM082_017724 [Marasmius tenuissimus]